MNASRLVLPTVLSMLSALGTVGLAAPSSAPVGVFNGPDGWSRVDVPSPTATRSIVQWHISGDTSTSVTYIKDDTGVFADSIALVEKNFSDNAIKPSLDKDSTCGSARARIVEFMTGPDGSHTIIHRMIVAGAPGVSTITYTRAEGNAFDADVKKAESAYCGA